MPEIEKSLRREAKQQKQKHGMRVVGKQVFLLEKLAAKPRPTKRAKKVKR